MTWTLGFLTSASTYTEKIPWSYVSSRSFAKKIARSNVVRFVSSRRSSSNQIESSIQSKVPEVRQSYWLPGMSDLSLHSTVSYFDNPRSVGFIAASLPFHRRYRVTSTINVLFLCLERPLIVLNRPNLLTFRFSNFLSVHEVTEENEISLALSINMRIKTCVPILWVLIITIDYYLLLLIRNNNHYYLLLLL